MASMLLEIAMIIVVLSVSTNSQSQQTEKTEPAIEVENVFIASEKEPLETHSAQQSRRSETSIARSGTGNYGPERVQPIPPLPPITVDLVDARGRLILKPNQSVQLQFRVTNHLPEPMFVFFRATLQREAPLLVRPPPLLRPDRSLIIPEGAETVTITVVAPGDAQEGETLTVTLKTILPGGRGEFRKGAYIRIGQQQTRDVWPPSVWWNYISVCHGAWDQATCNTNTWTIEYTIQDRESGLLSAMTSPRGLTFREPFISGTREPVKAYYTASCCASEVELSVEDGDGNRRTDKYNVHSPFQYVSLLPEQCEIKIIDPTPGSTGEFALLRGEGAIHVGIQSSYQSAKFWPSLSALFASSCSSL